ncbi:MAG: KpsF/GutQ family sugar-phosphate isomerase [Gammaproteobacteria bacterium]|jgi:arabinose-5-phosphate isomerase|nr:KpsF/GutQ family sugar-phosphate isomerase [Gammaproteobacteria bacterium]
MNKTDYQSIARQVFATEAKAVADLSEQLDEQFVSVVEAMLVGRGKVVVCGMGKSGIIGKKIAATFASTGTPSFFMHPGEAYHGDLGMVTPDDVFLALSNSGETQEVVKLVPFLRDNQNTLIAMTGNPHSSLAKAAHWHLNIAVHQEACPLQLAPTSSTTATLAMGDALAVTLMQARGFAPEEFARFHPGGSLGRRLLRRVADEMQTSNLPLTEPHEDVLSLINRMSRGGLGLAIVSTEQGMGVITDGDIRRALEQYGEKVFSHRAQELMTLHPTSVPPDTRVEDALALMEQRQITRLLVVSDGQLVGVFKK